MALGARLSRKKPWSRPIKAQNARIAFAILKLAPVPKNRAAGAMAAPWNRRQFIAGAYPQWWRQKTNISFQMPA
jgi:hypothetical protein